MPDIILGCNNFTTYGIRVLSTDTIIANTGQASGACVCDYAKIYFRSGTPSGVHIGTVYSTGVNKFTPRDYVNLGTISIGVQEFTGLSVDCEENDYAALYALSGSINYAANTLTAWRADDKNIFTEGELTLEVFPDRGDFSFILSGETVAAGSKALKRFGGIITETGFSKKVNLLILTETGWQKGI